MSRILGLDYGEKRLGFALSDTGEIIAMPLCVVVCGRPEDALKETLKVCAETKAERLVIGLPINMNGSKGPAAQKVLAFVELITPRLTIPVCTWDERLSTKAATNVLIEAGTSRQRRKEVVDKLAAQIMLQNFLDARENARERDSLAP
jgi:putative Holliday junction resolvase